MSDRRIEHRHGSEKEKLSGVPRAGRYCAFDDVAVAWVDARSYEVNFRAQDDLISLTMGAIRGREAFNSDKQRSFEVSPGTLNFYGAGSDVFISGEEVRGDFVSFAIKPSIRERIASEIGQPRDVFGLLCCARMKSPNALALAAATRRFIMGGHAGGRLVAESLAVLALTDFIEAATRPNARISPERNALDREKLDMIYARVEEGLADDLSLSDLAACVGLTPFHFARSFRTATGLSPYQYVLERRVAHARTRLKSSDDSLAEIAYAVGFSSQAHMTSVFRKRLGLTPGRYRSERRS